MTRSAAAPPVIHGSPSIRLLQLTTLVSTLDRFALPPMIVAIAAQLHVPISTIVHAASAYFLAYGLMQPVWGAVSDRIGRVRTMRLTLLVAGIFTLLSAVTVNASLLVVARGLAGGFFGAAYPSCLTYLGDTVDARVRQRDIARLMVGVAVGTAGAYLGAGVLADRLSWRAAFVLTGAAALALVVVLRRLPEPPLADRNRPVLARFLDVARTRAARYVLALALVEGAVVLGVLTLLPAAVEQAGSSSTVAGAVTAVYGVSVFAGSHLVGRLSQTWHPSRLIAVGATAATLACVTLTLSRSPVAAVAAAALLGLAWTTMHSSLQTWATQVLPTARASMVSLFAGSLFIGSSVGAVLVAGLADAGRYSAIFLIGAVLTVPLGMAASWARSRWHPSTVPG